MRLPLAASLVCLVAACAPTKIESTWSSTEKPAQPIQKFAVFAVTGSASGRIAYEETLTGRLKESGLPAIPGYDLVTYDEHPSKEEVLRRLGEKQIDGALVTRIDRRTTKTETTPFVVGGGVPTMGFYDYWYTPVAVGTYTTETNEFIVETVLYDLRDNRPYWAARSNTSRTAPVQFANDIGSRVAESIRQSGLVTPTR